MPLNDNNYSDYSDNNNPICPYCDSIIDVQKNELWQLYTEDIHFIQCPSCNSQLMVTPKATWTFSTDDQDGVDA